MEFVNCPACDRLCVKGELHCARCGDRLESVTPGDRLLELIQNLRVVIRNRSWSRMTEAAKSVQAALDAHLAHLAAPALAHLAQDFAQLLAPVHGADLVKIVTQAKAILPILTKELATPLQLRCDSLNTFLETLTTVEKQMKEKGAPSAEKIKAWLTPKAEKAGLGYAEAHACIYANPNRWPTLAAALDVEAYKPARLLINCIVAEKELREKNYGRAKKLFADLVARDAKFVRAWEGLGLTEAALKNMPEAVRCLREAVRHGTREVRTFNNLAWYLTTEGKPTSADLMEALVHARRAVELAPYEGFFDTLAEVHWRRKDWTEALTALRTACRLNPQRGDYRDKLRKIADEYQAVVDASDKAPFELEGLESGIHLEGDAADFEVPLLNDEDASPDVSADSDSEFELSLDEDSVFSGDADECVEAAEDEFEMAMPPMRHSEAAPREPMFEMATPAPSRAAPVEVVQTVPPRPITDSVHFTVTSQKELTPGEPTLIDVWAHLDSQRKEMLVRAREAQRGEEIASRSQGGVAVAQGSSITVQLKLPGFDVPEPESVIVWQGDIGNTSFQVFVKENTRKGKHLGTVVFYISGLQIARLNFDVMVGSGMTPGNALPSQTTRCKTAFASYSSKDRDEVTGRIQGMQKVMPGLDVFLDVAAMQSGEDWDARLRSEIARRDVFYLFWSANAAASKEVAKEWRLALELRGHDYIDPVPLAPPDVVPPPPELASKHFNDWVLAFRRNKAVQG